MRTIVVAVAMGLALVPRVAAAACNDPAALAAFRATVAAQCDCATATSHKRYVRCVAQAAAGAGLPSACRAAATRCAAKSTCGKAGVVTCCVQKRNGAHSCKLMRNAAACGRKKGIAGACASCCDACGNAGCPAGTTVTTTTTGPGSGPTSTITGSLPATSTTAPGGPHMVMVGPGGRLVFQPNSLTIAVGDTVRWVWQSTGHSVVSGSPGVADGRFCSPSDTACASAPTSAAGSTYEHTFTAPGTFPFFCAPHASLGMTGMITVH